MKSIDFILAGTCKKAVGILLIAQRRTANGVRQTQQQAGPVTETQSHNTIKDPQWYAVKGSDTTMMTKAASLPGQ